MVPCPLVTKQVDVWSVRPSERINRNHNRFIRCYKEPALEMSASLGYPNEVFRFRSANRPTFFGKKIKSVFHRQKSENFNLQTHARFINNNWHDVMSFLLINIDTTFFESCMFDSRVDIHLSPSDSISHRLNLRFNVYAKVNCTTIFFLPKRPTRHYKRRGDRNETLYGSGLYLFTMGI